MDSVNENSAVYYPESDGLPMGETELHQDWMIRILHWMRYRYRDQPVYSASNLLLYYVEGQPTRFVVPDVFVVPDSEKHPRRVFKTWEEGRAPAVVFEVTSKATRINDEVDKLTIYEEIGVQEYFLYDPTEEYLTPALKGFQLIDGVMNDMKPSQEGLISQTLGIALRLDDDGDLTAWDLDSGHQVLTGEEAERVEKEAERAEKEAERVEKEAERKRRMELEAEIEKLRRQLRDKG